MTWDLTVAVHRIIGGIEVENQLAGKRVFDLVKDFGISESPKSTRSSPTHWCPGRPGHPAFRHNIASSLRLHTGLPYDWTPRSDAPLGSPLAPSARRVSRVASRLPGTTRLRFALHGGQRWFPVRSDELFYPHPVQGAGPPLPGGPCGVPAGTGWPGWPAPRKVPPAAGIKKRRKGYGHMARNTPRGGSKLLTVGGSE